MLRQLISKWGIMSIELQNAFEGDMAVINEDGSKDYVETENAPEIIDATIIEDETTSKNTENSNNNPTDAAAALFG